MNKTAIDSANRVLPATSVVPMDQCGLFAGLDLAVDISPEWWQEFANGNANATRTLPLTDLGTKLPIFAESAIKNRVPKMTACYLIVTDVVISKAAFSSVQKGTPPTNLAFTPLLDPSTKLQGLGLTLLSLGGAVQKKRIEIGRWTCSAFSSTSLQWGTSSLARRSASRRGTLSCSVMAVNVYRNPISSTSPRPGWAPPAQIPLLSGGCRLSHVHAINFRHSGLCCTLPSSTKQVEEHSYDPECHLVARQSTRECLKKRAEDLGYRVRKSGPSTTINQKVKTCLFYTLTTPTVHMKCESEQKCPIFQYFTAKPSTH